MTANNPQRVPRLSWIWVGLVIVLVAGAVGTYLVLRANEQAITVEEVDPQAMASLIQEGKQVSVYFFMPT